MALQNHKTDMHRNPMGWILSFSPFYRPKHLVAANILGKYLKMTQLVRVAIWKSEILVSTSRIFGEKVYLLKAERNVHIPDARTKGWPRLQPEGGNSVHVSHMDGKDSRTWAMIRCFPDRSVRGWIRSVAGTQTSYFRTQTTWNRISDPKHQL